MARHPRFFFPGAIYHVYCRVARGEFVFDDGIEAIEFVETLRAVRDLDGWTILAWVLMGNHYHLVVKTADVELWRSMARLQGTVARSHNRRHDFLGRLWQSRYRARVVDTSTYLRQVVSYVHLNPVAAGVVEDPAAYRCCGHREILGLCRPEIVDRSSVLQAFEDGDRGSAVVRYMNWIRTVAEERWFRAGISELPWWKEAGHVDEIADPSKHTGAVTFDGQALAEQRKEFRLEEFLRLFENASGHNVDDLASRSRKASLIQGRIELTLLAVPQYGFKSQEVAARINKHHTSITRWLNRGLQAERDDPDFRNRIDALDARISASE